jgi:ribonuclease BN (tRNA processing enzyme)
MRLQVLGCGDAFGSGGRFNACFHAIGATTSFLIDCGASSMIAMRRFGVDPNGIRTIFISHLHGDHFGGLPFFVLDAQFVSRRTAPLTLAGPAGLEPRLHQLMEAMFPDSTKSGWRFGVDVIELEAGAEAIVDGVQVRPFLVHHPSGAPALALRFVCDGKTIGYTGDTEWVDAIIEVADGTDLFLAEASSLERNVPFHLNWSTLCSHRTAINTKRLLLTHMDRSMLEAGPIEGAERAEDGAIIDLG